MTVEYLYLEVMFYYTTSLTAKIQGMKNAVPKNDKKRRKQLADEVAKLEAELEEKHKEELKQLKEASPEQNKVGGLTLAAVVQIQFVRASLTLKCYFIIIFKSISPFPHSISNSSHLWKDSAVTVGAHCIQWVEGHLTVGIFLLLSSIWFCS